MEKAQEITPSNKRTVAQEKARAHGSLSLTGQDHLDMGSSPWGKMKENLDIPEYALMTDSEIEAELDSAATTLLTPELLPSGMERVLKEFLFRNIPMLESVGRLPEKYKGYDISTLG
jgi:hypothetical protein